MDRNKTEEEDYKLDPGFRRDDGDRVQASLPSFAKMDG